MLDLPSKWRGDTARLSCFIICQGLHVDKALIWMFGVSSSIRLNQIQAICLHVLSIWFYVLVCRQTWLSKKKNELHPVEKTEEKNNFEIFSFFCVVSSWASFLIAPQVKQLNSLNFIFFRFILCSDWIYTAYISLLISIFFVSKVVPGRMGLLVTLFLSLTALLGLHNHLHPWGDHLHCH